MKLQIVSYAESNGNRSAARLYGVNEKQVRNWRKEKSILQAMNPKKRSRRFGKEFWPHFDFDLNN
jgi:transposase-like protein